MEKFYKHTDNGILINIKVVPNSSRTIVMGVETAGIIEEQFLKIKISSPANENKANEELIKFLSKELKIPKTSIEIVKGSKNKEKRLLLKGFDHTKSTSNIFSL